MALDDTLQYTVRSKPISEITNLFLDGHLNLSPGFQRESVWTVKDRQALIDSILRRYPLPAIFLYRRMDEGHVVFDVIDGKQRLESIFMFIGQLRPRFEIIPQKPELVHFKPLNWSTIQKQKLQHLLMAYELPVIEVDGTFSGIVDLFVRINSTGKALSRQEKLHARYFNSPFLKAANRLANQFHDHFIENKILTAGQLSRMKHVELICELMLSLHRGDVLNKKDALDRVMKADTIDGRSIQKAARLTLASRLEPRASR